MNESSTKVIDNTTSYTKTAKNIQKSKHQKLINNTSQSKSKQMIAPCRTSLQKMRDMRLDQNGDLIQAAPSIQQFISGERNLNMSVFMTQNQNPQTMSISTQREENQEQPKKRPMTAQAPKPAQIPVRQLKKLPVPNQLLVPTLIYDTPLPQQYQPAQKASFQPKQEDWMINVEHGKAFSSTYGVNSHNQKRCLSREQEQELETVLYHYKHMTMSAEKRAYSLSPQGREGYQHTRSPHILRNLALARSVVSKAFMVPNQINGVPQVIYEDNHRQDYIKQLKESVPPKKKKKAKSLKRRNRGDQSDSDDGEPYGTRIYEKKTQLIPAIKKEDFKYWKPWLVEAKLPQWAEQIMDQPLYVQLGNLNDKPNLPRKKREPIIDITKTVEVDGVSEVNFSCWKINDHIQKYVDKISGKKAQEQAPWAPLVINPDKTTKTIEGPTFLEDQQEDHSKRLTEIYGKFLDAFDQFKDKNNIQIDVNDLTKPFDPTKLREKIDREAAVDKQHSVILEVPEDQSSIMTDSEFKFPIDIHIEPINDQTAVQNEVEVQPNFEIEEIGMGDQAMPFSFKEEEEDEECIVIDESDDLAPTEVSNNFCIEDDDFETISQDKVHHAKASETPFNFDFNQTVRSTDSLPVSDFAMKLHQMVKFHYDQAKDSIEQVNIEQVLPAIQQVAVQEEKTVQKVTKMTVKQEMKQKKEAKFANFMGEQKKKGPKTFTDKIDGWIDRINQKMENEATVTRALANNHLENQAELQETLKLFEESLKYHHENYEYQKKMRNAVKGMEEKDMMQSDTQKERLLEILRQTSTSLPTIEDMQIQKQETGKM